MDSINITDSDSEVLTLNLAIVGGGRTCKFFLELLQKESFPYLDLNIIGVCDVNPDAEGIRLAREMGIYTTQSYHEVLQLQDLHGVIELTTSREVLLDLIRLRPKGLWVIEHNIGRLINSFFITSKKLSSTEQQVALEKAVSEVLLQQTKEPIVLLDPDHTILDANQRYLESVNKPREEAIGGRCYDVIYGFSSPCSEWNPQKECPMLKTLRTGRRAHVIHEEIDDSDHTRYYALETYPVKNNAGEVVRVVEIRRDITEELPSRWEMRLRQLKTDLGKLVQEDRMLSLGKLSASCAHEINNPIQGMLTFAQLMETILEEKEPGPDDLAQFREYLKMMSSELERCGQIVQGLLSFARESTIQTRDVDLNEVLHSVINLTRHHMELQDIELTLELMEGPVKIQGDINQLQQCFLNLIFNSIEAMTEGGALVVTSRTSVDGTNAEVAIRDSGSGIPEDELDKIYDPFFTTKPEGEGTGLGLSIVYGIVKGHRGRIDVESQPGKGSTFTLSFPLPEES